MLSNLDIMEPPKPAAALAQYRFSMLGLLLLHHEHFRQFASTAAASQLDVSMASYISLQELRNRAFWGTPLWAHVSYFQGAGCLKIKQPGLRRLSSSYQGAILGCRSQFSRKRRQAPGLHVLSAGNRRRLPEALKQMQANLGGSSVFELAYLCVGCFQGKPKGKPFLAFLRVDAILPHTPCRFHDKPQTVDRK